MAYSADRFSSQQWTKLGFLVLGGGTIYKLSSIKDVFYVPMQQEWGMTNAQIGLGFTVYAIVQTLAYFLSMYLSDRFSKKQLLPIGLIGVGLSGLYLATLPAFTGYLLAFGALAFFGEIVYWPALLKAVKLLGSNAQQGRVFGYLETGRGVVDVIIAFGALAVFKYFGEGKAGMQMGILYYSTVTCFIGCVTYLILDSDDKIKPRGESRNAKVLHGIMRVVKNLNVWLAAFVIFFVYSTYIGLTYFIPFLKDIYGLPVALVGAYGIINQYGLKMVGGPIGGNLADKVFDSPLSYLRFSFLLAAVMIVIIAFLPHGSMSIYLGMTLTLLFGAIVFTQRAVFFAPISEIIENSDAAENIGAAMTVGCLVGYMPSMFGFYLYGTYLDKFPGMTGYQLVFCTMGVFSLMGFVTASFLLRRLNGYKSQVPAVLNVV